jgi:hypothetical protein
MDQLMAFVQDRWLLIAGALIVMFIVIKIVKTIMKWVIVIGLAAALLFYGANYVGELKELSSKVIDYSKEEAIKALVGQAKEAEYTESPDGTYKVSARHIELTGQIGSDEAKINFYGQTFDIKLDETLRAIVEQLKNR